MTTMTLNSTVPAARTAEARGGSQIRPLLVAVVLQLALAVVSVILMGPLP